MQAIAATKINYSQNGIGGVARKYSILIFVKMRSQIKLTVTVRRSATLHSSPGNQPPTYASDISHKESKNKLAIKIQNVWRNVPPFRIIYFFYFCCIGNNK